MQGPESGAWGGPGQAGPLHPWELRQPGPFPRESVGEQATVVPSCPSHPSPSLGHKRFCLPSLLLGTGWGLQAEGFLATRMSPEPGTRPDSIKLLPESRINHRDHPLRGRATPRVPHPVRWWAGAQMETSRFREGHGRRWRDTETDRDRNRQRDTDRGSGRDRDPRKMGFLLVKGWMVWRPDPMVCVCVCV